MTRSRKKTPCCHIVKRDGWWKKCFNRRVRRAGLDVPDGNAYRRMNESWLIDDFKCIMGKQQFSVFLMNESEDDRDYYMKSYIRK